jgi:flagellar basal-body rod modification protein FlgD
MSEINNNVSATSVYDQINAANQESSSSSSSSETSDSQMFMQLMIAQLQNQDPTSPADTADFMQQISNMTMVESMTELTSTMTEMSSEMMASQAALQASSMVGQQAFVLTDQATLTEGGVIEGAYSLDTSASNVTVQIYDSTGTLVDSWSEGAQATGEHSFAWGGGSNPAGNYSVVIQQQSSDGTTSQLDSYIGHTVNSVTLGQNGIGMKVNTDAGAYSTNDILQLG